MKRLVCFACVALIASIASVSAAAAASPIEGRWTTTPASVRQLVAFGMARKDALAVTHAVKKPALILRDGKMRGVDLATNEVVATGTYRLTGNVITFVFTKGVAVRLGVPYVLKWSVFGDRLTFSRVPNRPGLIYMLTPWTRMS